MLWVMLGLFLRKRGVSASGLRSWATSIELGHRPKWLFAFFLGALIFGWVGYFLGGARVQQQWLDLCDGEPVYSDRGVVVCELTAVPWESLLQAQKP